MPWELQSHVEAPIHIGKRLAKNRFVIQPMECGDANLRGGFSEDSLRRYEKLLHGGAGMVVMESVTLQLESRARKTQLLLDVNDPDNRDQWERFVSQKRMRAPDTLLVVQLNHSGELSDESFSRRVCVKPLPGFGGTLIDADYIEQTTLLCRGQHFWHRSASMGLISNSATAISAPSFCARLTTAAGNMAVRLKTAPGSRTNSAKKYAVPYRMKSF